MSVQIKGGKLLRLNYIIANQSDRLRLIAKLKQGYAEADAIKVNDLGGLTFEYKPSIGEETRNSLRIPKKLVEEYNAQLVEDANENEEDVPDFDSLEVLKGQLDYWVEQSVGGESIVFTENDIVAIEAVAGKVDFGRFVYSYAQNGLLDNTIIGRQKRFTSTRDNIATKIVDTEEGDEENTIVDGVVVINSLNAREIIEKIIAAVGNPEVPAEPTWEDYDAPVLFPEDIWLPVTHFKSGQTYTANIQSTALDFYGQIEFKTLIESDEGGEEGEGEDGCPCVSDTWVGNRSDENSGWDTNAVVGDVFKLKLKLGEVNHEYAYTITQDDIDNGRYTRFGDLGDIDSFNEQHYINADLLFAKIWNDNDLYETLSFYISSSQVNHNGVSGNVFIHNLTGDCVAVELLKNNSAIVSQVHLCPAPQH